MSGNSQLEGRHFRVPQLREYSHLAAILEFCPHLNSFVIVHVQQFSGGPSDRRDPLDPSSCHREVFDPRMFSRMKERHDGQRLWVDGAEIRTFVQIADGTSQDRLLNASLTRLVD